MLDVIIDGIRYFAADSLPCDAPSENGSFDGGDDVIEAKPFTHGEGIGPDGRWFPVQFDADDPPIQRALSSSDIERTALAFDVPAAHVDAVRQVEAAGSGFLLNEPTPARPKILFEGHWFYRLTPVRVSRTRPDLAHPRWTKAHYKGGSAEWGRLRDAFQYDAHNALKSASWGLGQIMGFNYELAGCETVEDMVVEAFSGEVAQFMHMMNYIENTDLLLALRRGDWRKFARGYNGPGYEQNNYHRRLAGAAKRSEFA
jgi:hypothetical protein